MYAFEIDKTVLPRIKLAISTRNFLISMKGYCSIFFFLALQPSFASDRMISYARVILPILSDKCFFCHGPDKDKQEADLRLDIREDAIEAFAWDPKTLPNRKP